MGFFFHEEFVVLFCLGEFTEIVKNTDGLFDEVDPGTAECGVLSTPVIDLVHFTVGVVDRVHQSDIGSHDDVVEILVVDHEDPATPEGFIEGLGNETAQTYILVSGSPFQSHGSPVDRLRLRHAPIQSAVLFVDLDNDIGIQFQTAAQKLRPEKGGHLFEERRPQFACEHRGKSGRLSASEIVIESFKVFESVLMDDLPHRTVGGKLFHELSFACRGSSKFFP